MRFYLKLVALLLLAAPAAHAQLWLGPSGVEVRVVDPKGRPLAGAQLLLRYTGVEPKDGPPPVLTDSRGRATAGSLAEGTWVLEVSHEGYMTYVANLALRRSARPEVLDATQLRVPGATQLLRVEVSKGPSSARPSAPASAAPQPAPAEPQPAPVAPAPPAVEKPAPRAPSSEPEPSPAPMTREPAPAVPEPAPARPSAPPAPTPVTPAPAAPAPATPPAAPAPAAPVPSAPASPPTDAVRLRSAQDRTCAECPPGESAVSVERLVPPGGGTAASAGNGCGADIARRLAGGEIPADLPAGCHVLRIVLPAGARYTAYRYAVQDGGESRDCQAGRDCSGVSGDAGDTGRWPINPVLVRKPQGTVVLAPFEAGPAGRERRAVLTAYFTHGKQALRK